MYDAPKRYKTREHIRNEMIREVARLWQHDEGELAVESFDPLVGMLLGAFATGLEGVYHELDNSGSRIVTRLANSLTPDVLTGPQPAHAVMKAGILDPGYEVLPEHPFSCNAVGKEFSFSSVGNYSLYKAKINTIIVQSRVKEMGSSPKENFMNEAIPSDEAWIGLDLDEDLNAFENLIFFFDWRNDPQRNVHLSRLSGLRMFSEDGELYQKPGLVNNKPNDIVSDEMNAADRIEKTVQRYYNSHFFSVSSRNFKTGENISLQKKKYPYAVASLSGTDDLNKYFPKDLFWVKIKFPARLTPDVLSRIVIDLNAFPVVNRIINKKEFDLKPLFNVFPVRIEDGEQFLGMTDVETPSGIKLSNVQQFSRDSGNQYLLRQRGVSRFDERDASDILSYMVDLLRDESAVFMALGQSEIDTDVDEIRKRLERINKAIKKDKFPNWFVTVKTKEQTGRINLNYWTTKADDANNIALGMKLNRDRKNVAFTDDTNVLLTTTLGGSRPLQGDDYLPVFKKAILTRGRLVTFEDYKAACFAELGNKLKSVEVSKGFSIGNSLYHGLQHTLEVNLIPNPEIPLTAEQWTEHKKYLGHVFEEQSSGIVPVNITISGMG